MSKKILTGILGVASFMLMLKPATANQIPTGYVLVPAEAFFEQNVSLASPNKVVEISTTNSSLRANDEISYVGENYSTITATLRDETGNPVENEVVNLVSSRVTDAIKNLQAATNTNGEAAFRILANEEGVSTFTAVVKNQTILERPRVVFLKKSGGIGGEFLAADVLEEDEDELLESLIVATVTNQIEATFLDQVVVNSPTDITIEIKDSDGEIVENFDGEISFESSDSLAILPRDYTFTELDRGNHTFANAITFITSGNQTVKVLGNTSVTPKEFSVNVVGSTEALDTPIITNPASGTLLNKTVTLLGLTSVNSNLVVFSNGQFVAEGESDVDGNFLIKVDLPDGQHEITIAILNSDNSINATSEAIDIEIDGTLPTIDKITLSPGNKVIADSRVMIGMESETGLDYAQLIVDQKSVELEESEEESGIYFGEFIAPTNGTYLLGIELTDEAGNVGEYPEAISLLVEAKITISDIEATPQDERIDLQWDPPTNHADIQNYKIFYGTDAENLDIEFETTDNQTAWFIDELNNNIVYYFQIISFDIAGNPNGGAEIISSTPSAPTPTLITTECDGKILLEWQPSENPRVKNYRLDYGVISQSYTGSRILPDGATRDEWEVRDLINGVEYFFVLHGVDDFGEVIESLNKETSATPQASKTCPATTEEVLEEEPIQLWHREDADGNSILVWNEIPGATSYLVYAGTQPEIFDLPVIEISSTSFRPEGLPANADYFFAVRAIYAGSHEAAALSNIAKIEVGPAETLLVSIILALTGSWLIRRKFVRN